MSVRNDATEPLLTQKSLFFYWYKSNYLDKMVNYWRRTLHAFIDVKSAASDVQTPSFRQCIIWKNNPELSDTKLDFMLYLPTSGNVSQRNGLVIIQVSNRTVTCHSAAICPESCIYVLQVDFICFFLQKSADGN